MRSPSILIALGSLLLAACVQANDTNTEPNPGEQLSPEVAAEIEDICKLPAGALTGKASVPDIREAAPKMACAVAEARKRDLNVGFISNPVDLDAQTH